MYILSVFTFGNVVPLKRHVSRINVAIVSNLLLGMPNISLLSISYNFQLSIVIDTTRLLSWWYILFSGLVLPESS